MPRGYRGIILSAFGWLALAAASPPPTNPTEHSQSNSQSPTRDQFERAIVALEAQKPDAKDSGCQSGEDNRQSDLCAQWKAADAAFGSMWAAIVGLLIGTATLGFAWRAAHWAKKAAEETARNANVTEKGLRAYLWVEKVIIRNDEGHPMAFECTLRNDGQTPGSKVLVEYTLKAKPVKGSADAILISQEKLTTYHRVAGEEPITIPYISFKNPAWPPNINKSDYCFLFLEIKVKWEDVFGKPDETEFLFALTVQIESFIGSYKMMTHQAFLAHIATAEETGRNTYK